MISTDPVVLQQVAAIIDFIKNVDSYKEVIISLQDAVSKYQDAIDTLSKGQNLATWEASIAVKAKKMVSDAKDAEESFAQRVAVKEQALADQATDLANRQAALIQAEKDLSDRMVTLSANEALVASRIADANQASDAVAFAQADIKQREIALQDKATKLQTLLGQ